MELKSIVDRMGIQLTEEMIGQFHQYYEMLVEKNKVMNLTAITEYDDVIVKHFADSLGIVSTLDMKEPRKIIDIGTGAGFPGIVLSIVFGNSSYTLLDSLNKRIGFLNEVITELQLKDIVTIHGRAEDYAQDRKYRGVYDLCVSRAVANLATLSEYCLPFVKVNGCFVAYKAGDCDVEIGEAKAAIEILGGKLEEVKKYTIPGTDIERTFVVLRKVKETPKMYPRKAGLPSKEPLR